MGRIAPSLSLHNLILSRWRKESRRNRCATTKLGSKLEGYKPAELHILGLVDDETMPIPPSFSTMR
jgi:hypothetical protein